MSDAEILLKIENLLSMPTTDPFGSLMVIQEWLNERRQRINDSWENVERGTPEPEIERRERP